MKLIIGFLIAVLLLSGIDNIALINSLKSEAKKAYQSGDYKTAAEKYQFLVDSLQVNENEVVMNLANALFQMNDTTQAKSQYQSLLKSNSAQMRSLSNLQLGVMANRTGKYEEALEYFKQSLRTDPSNEEARYNYEMVKKKLEEQKKQEEQKKDNKDQKKDQDKKDDQKKDSKDKENKDQKEKQDQEKKDQEKKDQDQQKKDKEEQEKKDKEKSEEQKEQEKNEENKEKKDIPPSVADKLKDMEMSEEKAKMILEAMKNQEIQYLQQNKRKATKPKDKTKPDW